MNPGMPGSSWTSGSWHQAVQVGRDGPARRIRECQVYSKIYHFTTPAATLRDEGVVGIILSGGPQSVYAKTAPHPDPEIFKLGVPVLGICYGVQLMGYFLGGKVALSKAREYGLGQLTIKKLAEKYNVSEMTMYRIKSGENWGRIK